VSCQKNVESVVQVFIFVHFEITNGNFHCKTITHISCYTYSIILKTVHFWLKYNGLAIVRKTTKLIEGGHRGLQDYRHMLLLLRFFLRFFKKSWLFTFLLPCLVRFLELCSTWCSQSDWGPMGDGVRRPLPESRWDKIECLLIQQHYYAFGAMWWDSLLLKTKLYIVIHENNTGTVFF